MKRVFSTILGNAWPTRIKRSKAAQVTTPLRDSQFESFDLSLKRTARTQPERVTPRMATRTTASCLHDSCSQRVVSTLEFFREHIAFNYRPHERRDWEAAGTCEGSSVLIYKVSAPAWSSDSHTVMNSQRSRLKRTEIPRMPSEPFVDSHLRTLRLFLRFPPFRRVL